MSINAKVDLKAIARQAMEKYGFEAGFPKPVLQEADGLGAGMILSGVKDAKDLRQLLWSSIDNNDSLDLDQLEYCEQGNEGEIVIKVAISDVDSFVRKGSRLDQYAGHNGTSVYLGVAIYPMLPDRLSHGMTSLMSGQDRLAVVIEYSVLADGVVRPLGVYRALVQNKAKLVYEEVGAWLEGASAAPKRVAETPGLEAQLRLQDEASQRLKRFRVEQGALEFDTIEAKTVMDADTVKDLIVQRKDRAHMLIENFMVAANGVMVGYLEKAGIPSIQRVVRTPNNWDGIVEVAKERGRTLPDSPDPKALSSFLDAQKEADPERFPDLSLTIVKLLGPGEYVMLAPGAEHPGHFSLAVLDYTHSTAPNRRYVDIIIQRLVKSILKKRPTPYTQEELVGLSEYLTEREKASKKVERFMRKAVAAVLLERRSGETFDAIVTGASEKGTYARLLKPPAEGRIVRGEGGLSVGQKVRVKLILADPYKGFIDFERIRQA